MKVVSKCLLAALYAIMLFSCNNKIRVSEYAKYNKIDHNWYQTFINDSLKLALDFWGRNSYTSFSNSAKYIIPKTNIEVLKSLGVRKKAKILLYLKPGIRKYGQTSYGYLIDKKRLHIDTTSAKFEKTQHGHDFFTLKHLFKSGDETSIVGGAEIGNKYFLLIESQKQAAAEVWDDSFQLGNTHSQLRSLMQGENAVKYITTRNKLIHHVDSIYGIPDYFAALNQLRAIPADTIEHYKADMYYYQDVVTRVSFFDNLDSIHQTYEHYRSPETTINPNNKFALDGDAIKKVYEIAPKQKMLMINESHYDFRHRLFVYLLLDSLYKLGYKNLCLEALLSSTNNQYINKEDGFYIREPFFATLIRRAREIGFNVYGYDTSVSSIPEREYGQAKNLYNLYSKDPNHKWLVLAGYAHINKRVFSRESKSALQNFTELAGFAPYSINQSLLSDILNQKYVLPDSPAGYFAVDTSSFVYKEQQADLYIINNIKKHPFEYPFPSIQSHLYKYTMNVPENTHPAEWIFIYVKKELDELHNSAIPVYMSSAGINKTRTLNLPVNDYVGIVINNTGIERARFEVLNKERQLISINK